MRKPDRDLCDCIKYNKMPIDTDDIFDVKACVPGEADGPDWFWVVSLKYKDAEGNKFGLIQGGCDYTGWD